MKYLPNNFENIEWEFVREGVRRKIYTGDGATLVLNELVPHHEPRPHTHVHEQISYIIQGAGDFNVEGEISHLEAGGLIVIPSNASHFLTVTSDIPVLNLDVFTPKREDYIVREQAR